MAARDTRRHWLRAIPNEQSTDEMVLPTPGFVVEPKLSCCSACEDFVEQSRAIDLDLRRAQADQARREAERRAQLLAATPAKLDPFDGAHPQIRLAIEQVPPKPDA